MELYLLNSEKLNSKKNRSIYSNKKSNELSLNINSYNNKLKISKKLFSEKNLSNKNCDISGKQKPALITTNLNYKYQNLKIPQTEKKRKGHISIEKIFHLSLMDEDDEISEEPEKFIEKLKMGQKLNKLLFSGKINDTKDLKTLNKFVNKKISNDTNKNYSNYSMEYIKKLNCNKNNYI